MSEGPPSPPYGAPPPPPYGAAPPPSYYSGPPPNHPQAVLVLVLGILGLVLSGILSPIAWGMASSALKDVAAGRYAANDQLKVGRILGIIGTAFLGLAVLVLIIGLIALVGLTATYR